MTNGQVVAVLNMITRIKESDRTLPVRLSYALNKNLQTLLEIYKPYQQSLKDLNLDGLSDDAVNALTEDDKKALADLLNLEADADLYKVTLSDLDGADLTVNEMEVIQTFMMDD